jgi:hypothetical protein
MKKNIARTVELPGVGRLEIGVNDAAYPGSGTVLHDITFRPRSLPVAEYVAATEAGREPKSVIVAWAFDLTPADTDPDKPLPVAVHPKLAQVFGMTLQLSRITVDLEGLPALFEFLGRAFAAQSDRIAPKVGV